VSLRNCFRICHFSPLKSLAWILQGSHSCLSHQRPGWAPLTGGWPILHRALPCLRPGCVLPLPPFTLVCSEMNFSSLVLRGISTPYLPWVPSSTRMKWEWLLSRHDRLPWFSSSSTYSAGKPPCKVREERLWEKPFRAAGEHQMPKATSTWHGNRPACSDSLAKQLSLPALQSSHQTCPMLFCLCSTCPHTHKVPSSRSTAPMQDAG